MSGESLRETMDRIGPAPDRADLDDVLRHVLKVYEDEPDDRELVTATRNVYGQGAWTGMTWGDLRSLAARVGVEWEGS